MADGEIKVVFTADEKPVMEALGRIQKAAESFRATTQAKAEAATAPVASSAAESAVEAGEATKASIRSKIAEFNRQRQVVNATLARTKAEADKDLEQVSEGFNAAANALEALAKAFTDIVPADLKETFDELQKERVGELRAKAVNAMTRLEENRAKEAAKAEKEAAKDAAKKAPPALDGKKSAQTGSVNLSGLSALSISGIPYISTLARAVLSPLGAAAAAAAASVRLFKSALDQADKAASTYARQLQSGGMPTGFVTRREILAKIIGVSEQEVLHFGKAVEYLSDRIALASSVAARTNRNLTALSWDFKILGSNMSALWASMTDAAGPALRELASGLNAVVEAAIRFTESDTGRSAIAAGIEGIRSALFGGSGDVGAMVAKLAKQNADRITGGAPMATTSINRLPASSWEKMGLVLGTGGTNPARETAQNTRRMADILTRIEAGLARGNGGFMQTTLVPTP